MSEHLYISYGIEQGMSQVTVNAIVQDHYGYIWAGTQDGLNRFDGHQFKTFKHNPNFPDSISHSFINQIIIDQQQRMWILTAAGLDLYDEITEQFTHFENKQYFGANSANVFTWSMQQINSNELWISTNTGLLVFNLQNLQFTLIESAFENGLNANNIYDVNHQKNGNHLAATDNGLFKFSSELRRFQPIKLPDTSLQQASQPRITCFSNQKHQLQFFCNRDGLYFYYRNQFHFISNHDLAIQSQVNKILLTSNNEIWLATANGVYVKSIQYSQLTLLVDALKSSKSHRLTSQKILSLFQDKDDVIWLGSDVSGLYKIMPSARTFEHYTATPPSSQALTHNLVVSINESNNGAIWIGDSQGGITALSNTGVHSQKIYLKDNNNQRLFNQILDVELDDQGNIWMAHSHGITKFSPASSTYRSYPLTFSALAKETYATQIIRSEDGHLWITGLESGLLKFNPANETFETVWPNNWLDDKVFAPFVYTAKIYDGQIWMAGLQGKLYSYDLKTANAEIYLMQDSVNDALAISKIYGLTQDREGVLWVSGMGGLATFDPRNQEFIYRSNLADFSPQTYYSLLSDQQGFIWSTTSSRLIRINPKDYSIVSYDRTAGMPIVEFTPAALAASNNKLYLGGINGMVAFDPISLAVFSMSAPVRLNQLSVKNNEPADNKTTNNDNEWRRVNHFTTQKIVIPRNSNHLKFEFSVLDFSYNANLKYRFRLQGFDENWHLTDTKIPIATYFNVAPGDFIFQVSTSLDGVNWSKAAVIKQVQILPYWWETLWAKLSFFLFGLVVLFISYKIRIAHHNKSNQLLSRQVKLRTKKISSLLTQRTQFVEFISHEIKTPLSLVINPLTKLANKSNSRDAELISIASRNANRISLMLEQLLHTVKVPTTNENQFKHRISINIFLRVQSLLEELSELAFQNQVSIVFRRFDKVSIRATDIEINSILANLLSNAIKHNYPQGKVYLNGRLFDSKFVINIGNTCSKFTSDQHKLNGKQQTGYGLTICQRAVDKLGGRLRIKSKANVGYIASLSLPINDAVSIPVTQNEYHNESLHLAKKTCSPAEKEENLTNFNELDTRPWLIIVEDDFELNKYLTHQFCANYQCRAFHNAELALEFTLQNVPDAIITDFKLPQMDGITFIQKIKNAPATCHIPVILLTANNDPHILHTALHNQAIDIVSKPFDFELLNLKLRNLLALTNSRYLRDEQQSQSGISFEQTKNRSQLCEKDQLFMQRFNDILTINYTNENYNLDLLSADMYLSKKQLSRKLKVITGKSPIECLKEFRLLRALEQLSHGISLSRVAIENGFTSQSYFSTCFKQFYGESPKQRQKTIIDKKRQTSQKVEIV